MIIGLTGKNGSGKGTVAEILKSRGFQYYSLSDSLRDELNRQKKAITREALIETGNRLRQNFGPSVLADRIIEKIDPDKNYVIDSIRNPFEVKSLQKVKGFSLFDVEAPVNIRFERCRKRAREGAEMTLAEFKKIEAREVKSADPHAQQLEATIHLADFIIKNGSTLEKLENLVIEYLKKITSSIKRPGWDEYFMNIARVVAQRSNCVKRHVAAIIVKDRRIISTGYNGTPRGVKNCNEGGCPRCNSFGHSGANLGECLCSHAEENSITQAAYHGVSIKGATIYTTFSPCLTCTKMIINSGIAEVIYDSEYSLSRIELALLKGAGIKVRSIKHAN